MSVLEPRANSWAHVPQKRPLRGFKALHITNYAIFCASSLAIVGVMEFADLFIDAIFLRFIDDDINWHDLLEITFGWFFGPWLDRRDPFLNSSNWLMAAKRHMQVLVAFARGFLVSNYFPGWSIHIDFLVWSWLDILHTLWVSFHFSFSWLFSSCSEGLYTFFFWSFHEFICNYSVENIDYIMV